MKQEIELKYQIASLADFKCLLERLKKQAVGSIETLKQKNIFFDTPALDLRKHKISLRLRRQRGTYYLCVKQKTRDITLENLFVRLEFEAKISQLYASLILRQLLSPLDVFANLAARDPIDILTKNNLRINLQNISSSGLQIIGSFINKRTKIPLLFWDDKIIIELDQTIYPDKSVVYELEIEFNSEEQAHMLQPKIEEIFRESGLKTSASIAKSDRLYNILF